MKRFSQYSPIHAQMFRRASNKFDVPLPEPLPLIRLGPGPAYDRPGTDEDFDYFEANRDSEDFNTIWLLPSSWHACGALGHETGHCFITHHIGFSKERRQRAALLVGHPGLRFFWGSWNPARHFKQPNEENVADMYGKIFCNGAKTKRQRKFLSFLWECKTPQL